VATASGSLVAYRDRSDDEIRDVAVRRWRGAGGERERALGADRWKIAGCPVNGPAAATVGDLVVVAWYSEGAGGPRVQLAWSHDGGATFAAPLVLDDAAPLGRVDVVGEASSAIVSWVARTGDGAGLAPSAVVTLRRVRLPRAGAAGSAARASAGEPLAVQRVSAGRASGFPRLRIDGERVLVAYTDELDARAGRRVRVIAVPLAGLG
jgi:hypothetical protein